MPGRSPRVLVVEDDDAIRSALEHSLRDEGYELEARSDGIDITGVAERYQPDIAILDVRLPVGPDGFMIARALRRFTDLPILFLTAADALEARLEGFEAGADDYLLKPFSMAELVARVQALLRRSGRMEAAVWQVGDLVVSDDTHTVVRAGQPLDLTHIEYQVLTTLMRNHGRVLSKVQLLNYVWGIDAYDVNVVEVHVSALRRKLEAHGPRLIHTVRGVGYVLRG